MNLNNVLNISAFDTGDIILPDPLELNIKQSEKPNIIYAKDTAIPTEIAVKGTADAILIQSDFAMPVKILAASVPEPLGFVVAGQQFVPNEPEPKKQTTGQMWAEILHEVAADEREAEKNKYLKVRKLEKTEPKTHLTTNFSISGLKPENK